MRKVILMLLFFSGIGLPGLAQNVIFPSSGLTHYDNTQVFRLTAGRKMSGRQWMSVIYRYPDFQDGNITLANGYSPTTKLRLNFNVYDQKIEYITEDGDTSVLENSNQLKSISIGNHQYVNDSPVLYVEKVSETPVSLGSKHFIKMMFESTNGERFEASHYHQPVSRLDRLFVKKDEYYFIDQDNKIRRATQPNIFKIYPTSKKELKRYIKEINVDFKNKEDLIGLLEYCKTFSTVK